MFLVKPCSQVIWNTGLNICSVYIITHSLYKEVLVKPANLPVLVTVSSNKQLIRKLTRLSMGEGTGQTSGATLLVVSTPFSSDEGMLTLNKPKCCVRAFAHP